MSVEDTKARIHARLRDPLGCNPPTPESPKTGLIFPIADMLVEELGNFEEAPPVKAFWNPSGGLPPSPAVDDRYIASATGNGWTENNIYAWTGEEWSEIPYPAGRIVYVVGEDAWYGAAADGWVPIAGLGEGLQGPRGFSVVGMRLDSVGNLYYSIEEAE